LAKHSLGTTSKTQGKAGGTPKGYENAGATRPEETFSATEKDEEDLKAIRHIFTMGICDLSA